MSETYSMAEKRINVKVEEDLHARLKVQAALKRMTMQDMVAEWLQEKLQESEGRRPDTGDKTQ